jgi:hypothetical protein
MTDKHKRIKEMGLERAIKKMHYIEGRSFSYIAQETGLPKTAIEKFLRDDKLKNFSDFKLEAIAKSDDYNALSLVETFFSSAAYASKELAMTAMLNQIIREEVAAILAEEGISGLLTEDRQPLINFWFKNSERLSKLSANLPKYLDAYMNLYTQVLDVQRSVSYVRSLTDAIAKVSPETHQLIMRTMDKDVAAKAVLNAMSSEDIAGYWQEKALVLEG